MIVMGYLKLLQLSENTSQIKQNFRTSTFTVYLQFKTKDLPPDLHTPLQCVAKWHCTCSPDSTDQYRRSGTLGKVSYRKSMDCGSKSVSCFTCGFTKGDTTYICSAFFTVIVMNRIYILEFNSAQVLLTHAFTWQIQPNSFTFVLIFIYFP